MFSKYKKPASATPKAAAPAPAREAKPAKAAQPAPAAPAPAPAAKPVSMRRAVKPAAASPEDREVKRKQRMSEIKLELHRALLDNLNLAALERYRRRDPFGKEHRAQPRRPHDAELRAL